MKNATFLICKNKLPFQRRWISRQFLRDNDPINTQFGQRTGLVAKKRFADGRVNLTVNGRLEFARDTRGANRAVAVDEAQTGPHRSAARPNDLANRLWFSFDAVIRFRRWVDAQIKPLPIERHGFKQLLVQVILGNTAVRRNAEVSCEKYDKGDARRQPRLKRIGTHN